MLLEVEAEPLQESEGRVAALAGLAALHPRRRALALACVSSGGAAGQAFLVDLGTGAAPSPQPLVLGGASEGVNATFACFSKEGDQTLVGTSKGAVHILDTATKAELKCVQLGGSSIKSLYLAKDGKSFLANSASSCCVRELTCVASHFQSPSSMSYRSPSGTAGGTGESKSTLGSSSSAAKKLSRSSPEKPSSAETARLSGVAGLAHAIASAFRKKEDTASRAGGTRRAQKLVKRLFGARFLGAGRARLISAASVISLSHIGRQHGPTPHE